MDDARLLVRCLGNMRTHETRIKSHMTTFEVIFAMSEGNPGAVSVLSQILKDGDHIDPDNVFGGFGAMLTLDSRNIYGSRIWMLYKDICRQDITKTIAMLRAMQLGIVDDVTMQTAIGTDYTPGQNDLVNPDEILVKVKERLPKFGGV